MIYSGFELWFWGCSIPRIKDQEGKRAVTYLTSIAVHWVMWSTWCALNAHEIRLLFLLSTSIIGRSPSWMSSCPSLPFLIRVQEITEQGIKYPIDVHARCQASEPCLRTYFCWAFLSFWKHLFTGKAMDRSAKSDVQFCIRNRSLCQCKEKATAARPPAASCAVPAGQADTAPWHRTRRNSAMKQLLGWYDRDISCVPRLGYTYNQLWACSHGTNARKEVHFNIRIRRWQLAA